MTSGRPVGVRSCVLRWASVATWLLLLVLCVLRALSGWAQLPALHPGAFAIGVSSCWLLSTALLVTRSRDAGSERRVWRWFTAAACSLGPGLVLVSSGSLWSQAPLRNAIGAVAVLSGLVASVCVYQGLLSWNRLRGHASIDPGDWLNGLGSVLVVTGLGAMVIFLTGGTDAFNLTSFGGWLETGELLLLGVSVTVAGTAGTVLRLGGLHRDPRAWAVMTALAVVCVVTVAAVWPADLVDRLVVRDSLLLAWLGVVVATGWAASRAPHVVVPRTSSTQAPAIGSLVVLLAAVAVLMISNAVLDRPVVVTTACGGAVLAVSARVINIFRSLVHLARAQDQASTDSLTGVANRRAFVLALHRAQADTGGGVLAVLDLNGFKAINDRYGHGAGDDVLRATARRLSRVLPPGGVLARLGGDEFAVVVPWVSAAAASALTESMRRAVSPGITTSGARVKVGLSVGWTWWSRATAASDDELIRQADVAMYQAKSRGGGVLRFDPESDCARQARTALADELQSTLDELSDDRPDHPVVAYFQPQVDLRSGQVTGLEALVRWDHPQLGVLSPDQFLDLVEQRRLMPKLTRRVLSAALTQVALWREDDPQLRVSVNVSASCVADPDLRRWVEDGLKRSGIPAQALVVEITETSLMVNQEQAVDSLRALRALGVGVSIDDYGTGYSSLAYLADLPATELKIDRSFTQRLIRDRRTASIVEGMAAIAHRLGMRVVVEGAESDYTNCMAALLGCDESQGYVYAKPLPAHAVAGWIRQHQRTVGGRQPV